MKKLFTLLLFVSLSTIIFSQQVEYYVGGINFYQGDTLKFGMDKNAVIPIVLKKMTHKNEFTVSNDSVVFNNIVLDGENYDILDCYFGEDKLYKIILKTYIGADEVNQIPELRFNMEVQKKLIHGEKFIVQQIYKDTKSKYNK